MRSKLLLALGVVAGMLFASPAKAQTFTNNAVPGFSAPGNYSVTVSRANVGDPFTVVVESNGGADDLKQINITFYTGLGATGTQASVVATPNAGATVDSPLASDSAANGLWDLNGSTTGAYDVSALNPSARVLGDSSNRFQGTAILQAPNTVIQSVGITLSSVNAPGAYLATIDVSADSTVPEPGALALALPGLAPLGFMLRRRFRKNA